jgi:HSP20 family protein
MIERFLPKTSSRDMAERNRPRDVFDLMGGFRGTELPFPVRGYPSVDISETENNVLVKAELPGLDPRDVDLSIERDTLIIRGEKKQESEEKQENYHRIERSYGSFHRSIPLPCKCDPDKVKAKFKNGVLTVTLPKDRSARPRRVTIES